jgi:D-alanyl-D-alanine carboxypeptidase
VSWSTGLREDLVPWFQWIVAVLQYYDPTIAVSSAYRSYSEQAKLYRRYEAGLMPGPVAPPGQSKHEQGRAIDVWSNGWRNFDPYDPPEALRLAGAAWQSVGGTWGGAFSSVAADPIHFEA